MKKVLLYLLFCCVVSFAGVQTHFISFGPRVAVAFGESWDVTLGFETSYWVHNFGSESMRGGAGFNIGIEQYLSGRTDLYSELQFGMPYAGLSVGGFRTIAGDDLKWGFQSTVWGLVFVGVDYRYKYNGASEHQLGAIGRYFVDIYEKK